MRIAYCQISAHQSYVGAYGSYCKEPIIDKEGALLTRLDHHLIKNVCDKIEEKYSDITKNKLIQILKSLSGKEVDCVVFPEYSIPATSLDVLYEFAQRENCICIAASHTIQGIYEDIYKKINLKVDLNRDLGMSCCPIIFPSNQTIPVFKKYKSKWESNMNTEDEKYSNSSGIVYVPFNSQQIAVAICIDALKTDVDPSKIKLLIVPAASPSTGQFKNKFEGYLSRNLPTVFCNHYQYGGSTIYCHVPIESNAPFVDTTQFIQLGTDEEAIVIANIDISSHILPSHSVDTKCLASIENILPIYYRENANSIALMDKMETAISESNFDELNELISLLLFQDGGLLNKYKNYLLENIKNRSLTLKKIANWLQFIYINEFSLKQYERNWVEKTLELIQNYLMEGTLTISEAILKIQKRLYEVNAVYIKQGVEKIDLPVFSDSTNEDSTFQNRGGEIQQFKIAYQETGKTIFILNGFASVGKSALVKRLKFLYSFNTIEKNLSRSAGFESFLRAFFDIIKQPLSWDTLDKEEIESLAKQISQKLCLINKTIFVIRSIGNIFDDYNTEQTTMFLNYLAEDLARQNTHIKIIIEISRTISDALWKNTNIHICKLKPLLPLYIERLIEQIATKVTYSLALPVIPKEIISACNGNPSIAELVGIYLGKKINEKNESALNLDEVNSFTNKHVDGILSDLQISDNEKAFLQDACIYRIPVKKYAYEEFDKYKKESLEKLINDMIIENDSELFSVNPVIYSRFNRICKSIKLHKIAADYHDREYKALHVSIDKAEYIYHISFCNPTLRKNELQYFSDDVLSAAIKLINDTRPGDTYKLNMAMNHLESIKHWKDRYWKYNIYVAYCKILLDDYQGYQEAFDKAVSVKVKDNHVAYYLMANKLIRARKQGEAETLLNTIEDLFGESKQLSALWVMLRYSNNSTKKEAISTAKLLTKAKQYDLYASKILVRIYLHEGLVREALEELETVFNVWRNNEWAKSIKYQIQLGTYDLEENEDDEDVEDN